MDEALGVEEVLSDVALDMNLIVTHVTYLSHHIAAILLCSRQFRESDSNLPQNRI